MSDKPQSQVERDNTRYVLYGAAAALGGVMLERFLRACTVDNMRYTTHVLAEAKRLLFGNVATRRIEDASADSLQSPLLYPESPQDREPVMAPPPAFAVPVARPITSQELGELQQRSEVQDLLQQLSHSAAISLPWYEQ